MSEILSATFDLVLYGLQTITDFDGVFAPIFILLFLTMCVWQLLRLFRV